MNILRTEAEFAETRGFPIERRLLERDRGSQCPFKVRRRIDSRSCDEVEELPLRFRLGHRPADAQRDSPPHSSLGRVLVISSHELPLANKNLTALPWPSRHATPPL